MRKHRKIVHKEAGLTLIEMMITAGVLTVGIVVLMQSLINMVVQGEVAEIKTIAGAFNAGVLEDIRGNGIDEILQYDGLNLGDDDSIEIVGLEGKGVAKVSIYYVHFVDQTLTETPIPAARPLSRDARSRSSMAWMPIAIGTRAQKT